MDCNPPGSSVHGILQARILEWVAIPFSRGSSWPRDRTHVSYAFCIGRWFFTIWATREAPIYMGTHIHILGGIVSLIFLKISLVFPILLFSSISLHSSLRKAVLSLLAILWNSALRWVYLSFYPLPLTSLLCSANFQVSPDNHFAFLHFFFNGILLSH